MLCNMKKQNMYLQIFFQKSTAWLHEELQYLVAGVPYKAGTYKMTCVVYNYI